MQKQNMTYKTLLLIIISLLIGVFTWVIVEAYVGIEAWDHGYYWLISYPILILTSLVLSVLDADKKLLWGVLPLLAQGIFVFLSTPEGSNLLPLTAAVYFILLIPTLLASYLGAWISNKYIKQR